MNWTITARIEGELKAVGFEAEDVIMAVQRCGFAAKAIVSCVMDELEPFEPGPDAVIPGDKISWKDWIETHGENGKFPLISENIIRWVEERG